MKKHLLLFSIPLAVATSLTNASHAQTSGTGIKYTYKQITAIESVTPGGLGRSRILTTDDAGQMAEKELKNFYSMVGIQLPEYRQQ